MTDEILPQSNILPIEIEPPDSTPVHELPPPDIEEMLKSDWHEFESEHALDCQWGKADKDGIIRCTICNVPNRTGNKALRRNCRLDPLPSNNLEVSPLPIPPPTNEQKAKYKALQDRLAAARAAKPSDKTGDKTPCLPCEQQRLIREEIARQKKGQGK